MRTYYEGKFNGIRYNSWLYSSEGVEMHLFVEPHHTKEDIKKAKAEAKSERDVVFFRVIPYKEDTDV